MKALKIVLFETTRHRAFKGPRQEKTCLPGFVNNKDTDQPVYLRSLISTFNIRLLESSISKLAADEILIF